MSELDPVNDRHKKPNIIIKLVKCHLWNIWLVFWHLHTVFCFRTFRFCLKEHLTSDGRVLFQNTLFRTGDTPVLSLWTGNPWSRHSYRVRTKPRDCQGIYWTKFRNQGCPKLWSLSKFIYKPGNSRNFKPDNRGKELNGILVSLTLIHRPEVGDGKLQELWKISMI